MILLNTNETQVSFLSSDYKQLNQHMSTGEPKDNC